MDFKSLEGEMYARILVAIDGSESSVSALREAIQIAKVNDSRLRLLHVVRGPEFNYGLSAGQGRKEVIASLCQAGKSILSAGESIAREQGLSPECMLYESVEGSAAGVILDQAQQWPADLIVIGSHARHGFVGSDTGEILAKAGVPVLLIRRSTPPADQVPHRRLDYASVG